MAEPRYRDVKGSGGVICEDCGVLVIVREAHTRFHSILSGHAWMLAILKTSHVGPKVHDRYDVIERADRRTFDSWSGDALAEVIADMDAQDSH
jgi:hypothetical protein